MEIKSEFYYTFRFTEQELGLVIRGLGLLAGIEVVAKEQDRGPASDLNRQILRAKESLLKHQLGLVEKKLDKVEKTR